MVVGDKTPQRITELLWLNAVIDIVNQALDQDEDKILNDALGKILAVMRVEAGVVHMLNEGADQLVVTAHRGLSSEYVQKIVKLKPGEGIAGRVVQSGEPIVVNDTTDDPKVSNMIAKRQGFRASASVPSCSQCHNRGFHHQVRKAAFISRV